MSNVIPLRRPVAGKERSKPLPPRRVPNLRWRSREHLTDEEVERLMMAAATVGRHGSRDATLILLAYRHGLRVSELVSLHWHQVDFARGTLYVTRCKRRDPGTHPLIPRELEALRHLHASADGAERIFQSERGGALTTATVRKLVARAGRNADLGFTVHPHMLRHATGYHLANRGVDTRTIQAYLGHRNIMRTVRYTQLAADRFRTIWSESEKE